MFVPIEKQTLIPKNGGKRSFSMNPKRQCHSSQWRDWVYGAQSWKEKRLLCEFVFVPNEKQTLILKNGGERSFSYETKALMSFILMSGMSYSAQSWKKRDY